MRVAVVGLGKAGLPLACVIADSGLEVKGVDISPERVRAVNNAEDVIPEERGLHELLQRNVGRTLNAYTDVAQVNADAYIVIVPLFIDENKKCDFSILRNAFESIAENLKDGDLVVLETTVPPGTTSSLLKAILDKSGKKYYLAYSPERIMTGVSVSRYKEFPKVVGGVDRESGEKAYSLYSRFCNSVSLVSNAKTAEMVKVAEGVYRDVNISLANELMKVCEAEGIDYADMRGNANHKYCDLHMPGNVGGHCIPVYPWFLINKHHVPLISSARKLNDDMIEYYADKLSVKSGKIAVLGLTYRDNVKELAYTRSLPMVKLLESRGYDVYANDPMMCREEIEKLGLKYCDDFSLMDGIVLMNKCAEYKDRLMLIKDKVVDVQGGLK